MRRTLRKWLLLSLLVGCVPPQVAGKLDPPGAGGNSPSVDDAGKLSVDEKNLLTRLGGGLDALAGTPADTLFLRAGERRTSDPSASGTLISNSSAALISNSSAALISNSSAALITNGAASLIANSAASLIANGGASLIANGAASLKTVAPFRTTSQAALTFDPRFAIAASGASGGVRVEDSGVWPDIPVIGRVSGRRTVLDARGDRLDDAVYEHQIDAVDDSQVTAYDRQEIVSGSKLRSPGNYRWVSRPEVSETDSFHRVLQTVDLPGETRREYTWTRRVREQGSTYLTLLEGRGLNSRGLAFATDATTSVTPGSSGSFSVRHELTGTWDGGSFRLALSGIQESGGLSASGSIGVALKASASEPALGLLLYLDQRFDPPSGKVQLAYDGALLDAAGKALGRVRSYRHSSDGSLFLGVELAPDRIVPAPQGWLDLLREGASGW